LEEQILAIIMLLGLGRTGEFGIKIFTFDLGGMV
jgi:hypothetical protein